MVQQSKNIFRISARALSHGRCKPRYSVVLVAFDLEEFACQGSLAFVQEFLLEQLGARGRVRG